MSAWIDEFWGQESLSVLTVKHRGGRVSHQKQMWASEVFGWRRCADISQQVWLKGFCYVSQCFLTEIPKQNSPEVMSVLLDFSKLSGTRFYVNVSSGKRVTELGVCGRGSTLVEFCISRIHASVAKLQLLSHQIQVFLMALRRHRHTNC